jgi:DNA integrity scanning protein DisA with diadenylate cyclase activity
MDEIPGRIKVQTFKDILSLPFYKLDRRIRQDLLAIDGALILDHRGNIIAFGEILEVGAGSEGGGRTLAAKTLSDYGLGIKVSADGPITAYRDKEKIFSL